MLEFFNNPVLFGHVIVAYMIYEGFKLVGKGIIYFLDNKQHKSLGLIFSEAVQRTNRLEIQDLV